VAIVSASNVWAAGSYNVAPHDLMLVLHCS
jgi:hypothetical protein